MIRIAIRDVVHHRRETVGVIGQIAAGIAIFVVALSFVGAIGQNADRLLFGTVGAPWLVQPESADDVLSVDGAALEGLGSSVGADSVRSRLELSATLANPSAPSDRPQSASVALVGADLAAEPGLGENFDLPTGDLAADGIVLAEKVARQLGATVGDRLVVAVGPTALDYRVAAVVSARTPSFVLENWVIVDRSALAQGLYADPHRSNRLLVDAPQTEAARSALGAATGSFRAPTTVSLWSDTSWSSLMIGPTVWAIVLVVASTFLFFVICVGLTSLVYSALLARVRDFAVLKTAGATSGSLMRLSLGQVVVQYAIGYAGGALLATIAVLGANAIGMTSTDPAFTFAVGSSVLTFVPTWWAFLAPLAIGLVVTLTVLWFPIRSICSLPVLDLLETR